jgi:beta-aspartyl-dipeptidase (metallo-type)
MLTLLKSLACFGPEHVGERDILLAGTGIYKITRSGELGGHPLLENTVDCRGLYAFPGFVDQHIHITGAGGEKGFESRTRELEAEELFEAGITTAVGLLGAMARRAAWRTCTPRPKRWRRRA